MLTALVLIVGAALSGPIRGQAPLLIARGADPARGLLVNRTAGSRPFDPPDPARPTVVFIHGFNPTPRLVHFEMAERVSEALARRGVWCNVLDWDWNAATCDSLVPRVNSENSVEQGRRLAGELARAGVDPTRTQLIGHSAGCLVATSAAWVAAKVWCRPVAQLTLLDAATYYHSIIFDRLQAGTLAPLVENCYTTSPSAFGKEVRLPGVVDAHVVGRTYYFGVVCPLRSDHVSIVGWYLTTIEDRRVVGGFQTNTWIERR